MAESTTAGTAPNIPSGAADIAKSLAGTIQGVLGNGTVQGVAGTVGKYADIASFFTGFITDSTDTQTTVKEVADTAKFAESFSKFMQGKQTAPKTIGDLVESLKEYNNFKEDVEAGDGPMWAAIKSKIVGKIYGWLAEKGAEIVGGIAGHALGKDINKWTLPQFNEAVQRERGGEAPPVVASSEPTSGLPKQAGAGKAKA